jgi:hypothetical protein
MSRGKNIKQSRYTTFYSHAEVQHLEGGLLRLDFLGGKEPGSIVYLKLWQHHDDDKLADPRVCVVDDQ